MVSTVLARLRVDGLGIRARAAPRWAQSTISSLVLNHIIVICISLNWVDLIIDELKANPFRILHNIVENSSLFLRPRPILLLLQKLNDPES